ncbi:MAG: hypothetical protein PVF91_00305 [Chromatiales bacterium]|jgi:hypothetical protein
MSAPRCPFQTPIIAGDFECSLGDHVTVRNAPQVHCRSPDALRRCERVYARLKDVGLPAFGMEDDLLSTPHSVMQKIQYGGLLGLQSLSGLAPESPGTIPDIGALIERLDADPGLDALPYSGLASGMTDFQLKRRRGRRR